MLTSFPPPPLSEVWEERGEVWGEGGSWRLYWLCWGWKLFLFFSLPACLASLCTFNNAFPVHAAVVVAVCIIFNPLYLIYGQIQNTMHDQYYTVCNLYSLQQREICFNVFSEHQYKVKACI